MTRRTLSSSSAAKPSLQSLLLQQPSNNNNNNNNNSSSGSTIPTPNTTTTTRVVMVTAPHCAREDSNGVIEIESEQLDTLDIIITSSSSSSLNHHHHDDDDDDNNGTPTTTTAQPQQQPQQCCRHESPIIITEAAAVGVVVKQNNNNDESSSNNNNKHDDDDDDKKKKETNGMTHIVVPAAESQDVLLSDGFDVCHEYAYQTKHHDDDDDNDDDANNNQPRCPTTLPTTTTTTDGFFPSNSSNDNDSNDNDEDDDDNDDDEDDSDDEEDLSCCCCYEEEVEECCYHVLGRTYSVVEDHALKRQDEASLFWFTYRCDFIPMEPYQITTDAGWGCMLRSAQMLLAQTLKVHYMSRTYQPPSSSSSFISSSSSILSSGVVGRSNHKNNHNNKMNTTTTTTRLLDSFTRQILTWFADFPSQTEHVFSLHNMVAAGIARYQVLPGEWWGPGTVSHVLCDLCQLLEEQQQQEQQRIMMVTTKNDGMPCVESSYAPGDLNRPIFRVYVASQGTVYRDTLVKLMTRNTTKKKTDTTAKVQQQQQQQEKDDVAVQESRYQPFLSHPLETTTTDQDDGSAQRRQDDGDDARKGNWDTACLLLIPLRLGLKNFNEDYSLALAHTFSLSQSVGVLGGRPRGARWFYGAMSDGSKLFGLDPHTVQSSPYRTMVRTNVGTRVRTVAMTNEYVQSVHTKYPETVPLQRMDPSMSLGFYCRNETDFRQLCHSLQEWQESHPNIPKLFTIEDCMPDYCANVSLAMNEMLLFPDENAGFSDKIIDEGGISLEVSDEEDEYVML